LGANGSTYQEEIQRLDELGEREQREGERIEAKIGDIERKTKLLQQKLDYSARRRDGFSSKVEQFELEFEARLEDNRRRIEQEAGEVEIRIKKEAKSIEERIRNGFEELREEATEIIMGRVSQGKSQFTHGVKRIIEGRQLLSDSRKKQSRIKRLRELKQLLDSKTYKEWI